MTRIISDVKLDYSDVLLVPQRSSIDSRQDVDLLSPNLLTNGIPIIAANMDGVGTFRMAEALARHRMFTALVKHYSVEDLVRFYTDKANADIIPYTIYSMGANKQDLEKFEQVIEGIQTLDSDLDAQTEPRMVCIDAANGYTDKFAQFVEEFKESYGATIVIAGNVCTPEAVRRLSLAGAYFVKIGIGPGGVCTTRQVAGVGYPQFSAVLEACEAALEADCGVIADGGCTCPGDVLKAFAAGAKGVMLGSMLAGHDEGDTAPHLEWESAGVRFHGMASKAAQELHNGGVRDYRSSEGREVVVPYRGPVDGTVRHILGGLRSGMAYVGARELVDLQDTTFVKVNRQLNNAFPQ